MEKIIGKITIFVFLIFSLNSYCAKLEVSLQGLKGRAIKQLIAGIPFNLKISIEGVDSRINHDDVQIGGLENFDYRTNGKRWYAVNNNVTQLLFYQICIDEPGEYSIGPVKISLGNEDLFSEPFNVLVKDPDAISDDQDDIIPRFKLEVDKKRVFIGEKLELTYKLYIEKSSHLEGVEELRLDNVDLYQPQQSASEAIKVNDKHVIYYELKQLLYPLQSGELKIPSLKAIVNHDAGHGNLRFIIGPVEQELLNSSPLKILVEPLPNTNKKVDAVGIFNDFKVSMSQSDLKVGEGAILTFTLEGDTNFEKLEFPKLIMPASIRFYNSKENIEELPYGYKRKIFEYVIQPLNEGIIEIPKQIFNYFDIDSKTYKKLETESICINAKSSNQLVKDVKKDDEKINQEVESENNNYEIISDYQASLSNDFIIPSKIFYGLIFLPLIISVLSFSRSKFFSLNNPKKIKKASFAKTKRKIKLLKQRNDCKDLYKIFSDIQKNFDSDLPKLLNQEELKEWNEFFIKINECAFANYNLDSQDVEQIFKLADYWVNIFERKL